MMSRHAPHRLSLAAALCLLALAGGCGGGASTPTPPPALEIAVTPAGTALGTPAATMVPTTGARLTSADGRLTVDVPADALAAPQTLTLQPIGNEAPGGVGVAYRLGPEGTTFAKPVTLTFTYSDAELVGSTATGLGIGYQDAQGQWNAIKAATHDPTTKTISVVTTHFSDWSLLEGWQLRPATATVRGGESIDLTVYNCTNLVAGTDELAELRYKCRPEPDIYAVQEWAANGVVGGSAAVGTLGHIAETSATYTAPTTPPANNPVAVSATVLAKSTGTKTVLTSNILVNDHPSLMGVVNSKQMDGTGLTITTHAEVTFVWNESQERYQPGAKSTLAAQWDIVADGCETHGLFNRELAAHEGTIIILDRGYFPTGAAMGTYRGTTMCVGGQSEAFSKDDEVEWWPSPPESILTIKSDGKLEDHFTEVLGSGLTVSADWSLAPIVPEP